MSLFQKTANLLTDPPDVQGSRRRTVSVSWMENFHFFGVSWMVDTFSLGGRSHRNHRKPAEGVGGLRVRHDLGRGGSRNFALRGWVKERISQSRWKGWWFCVILRWVL